MTDKAEKFLHKILTEALISIDSKYRKGDKKYAGDLLDLPLKELVNHALLENIDQYTYLKAIEHKLNSDEHLT